MEQALIVPALLKHRRLYTFINLVVINLVLRVHVMASKDAIDLPIMQEYLTNPYRIIETIC